MKKIFLGGLVFLFLFLSTPKISFVYAADCSDLGITLSEPLQAVFDGGDVNNELNFIVNNVADNENYHFILTGDLDYSYYGTSHQYSGISTNNQINFLENDVQLFETGNWTILLSGAGIDGQCTLAHYSVTGLKCKNVAVFQDRSDVGEALECFGGNEGGCLDSTHDIVIRSDVTNSNNTPFTGQIIQDLSPGGSKQGHSDNGILQKNHGKFSSGNYDIIVRQDGTFHNQELCRYNFSVAITCNNQENSCVNVQPISANASTLGPDKFSLCNQISETQIAAHQACVDCVGENEDDTQGIWTAIGCIKKDPRAIIEKFIKVGLGIGGGIALLSFLAAGFIYSTSEGNPEKLKSAKEMMTSSIIGLLFVIFSVTILQFIGWSILKIPGFGGP